MGRIQFMDAFSSKVCCTIHRRRSRKHLGIVDVVGIQSGGQRLRQLCYLFQCALGRKERDEQSLLNRICVGGNGARITITLRFSSSRKGLWRIVEFGGIFQGFRVDRPCGGPVKPNGEDGG